MDGIQPNQWTFPLITDNNVLEVVLLYISL